MNRRVGFRKGRVGQALPSFLPTNIAGCVVWFNLNRGGFQLVTGVSSLTDMSNSGNSIVQATGANQPLYSKTGGPNGLPCMTFNGTSQFLAGTTVPTAVSNCTVFMVEKATSAVSSGTVYSIGSTTGVSFFQGVVSGSKRELNFNGAATDECTGTATSTNWEVWTMTSSGTPLQTLRVNGVGQTVTPSNTATAAADASHQVGTRGGAVFFNGSIYEIIVYNTVLPLAQIQQVENYIRTMTAIF